ncbi:MAG: LysR family transcriptional regulator [Xanthomonadales bacterium]|nr:LysR family transcriptional regulator [Xanthomonadales bacterium]
MDIRDIIYIHSICHEGSFKRASKLLGISQATLASRVELLEVRLGVTLFNRQRGRSKPTSVAQFISEQSKELHDNAFSLLQETRQVAEGVRGHLRIGFGPASTHLLLRRIITRLRENNSKVTLQCKIGSPSSLVNQVSSGEIDVVLGPYDPNLSDDRVTARRLWNDEIVIVMRPEHPLAAKPPRHPEILFRHPIALTRIEPRYQVLLRERYGQNAETWSRRVNCSSFPKLIQLIIKDGFISAGPRSVFQSEVDAGRLVCYSVPDAPVPHNEYLISNNYSYPVPALAEFVDAAQAEARVVAESVEKNLSWSQAAS